MENKLTVTALAAMIALATGKSKEVCEQFLQELFSLIADELERGESVRIKGFGTFKLIDVEARKSVDVSTGEDNEIPAHKRVAFVAAKELADLVNDPFEVFEAVELADEDDSEEDFVGMEVTGNTPEAEGVSGMKDDIESASIASASDVPEILPVKDDNGEEQGEEPEVEAGQGIKELETALDSGVPPTRRGRFGWGFLTGFLTAVAVLALGAVVWFLFAMNDPANKRPKIQSPESVIEEQPLEGASQANLSASNVLNSATDSVIGLNSTIEGNVEETGVNGKAASAGDSSANEQEDVPTQPSDRPVYDTVSTTRYLTTMAKEHYGNFNLWPIIYEENKAILGHPDRIKPGTQVVVPPLSKYGIDPNNPEDVKRMKRKGTEIYSRYK